jgi:hypothetical protein
VSLRVRKRTRARSPALCYSTVIGTFLSLSRSIGWRPASGYRGPRIPLSKGAVTNAVQRAVQKGLSWPLPEELDDSRQGAMLLAPRRRKPGPKSPGPELVTAIVEMKRRNPRFGYRRIAQQIAFAFGVEIDKDDVRRVLAKHCRPEAVALS